MSKKQEKKIQIIRHNSKKIRILIKQGDTMKLKHYISLFLILILSSIIIHIAKADTHSELNNIFTLDTREEERIPLTHSALSNIFTLDTREAPPEIGLSHSALSNIFTLDTRETPPETGLKHSALSNTFTLDTRYSLDVNNDGKVDINDLTIVGSHFGESTPKLGDVNEDGMVDIRDMVLIGIHFGE
jgi:hypothetical protein